ncbi:MAG: hypothetical protein J6S85_16740 [Methanobrevibacter sp.]|nr:hypothetical protein [Methanobrevibacter sp.]
MNNKTLELVRKSAYALTVENAYKNVAYFSGWVVQRPRIIKHDKTGKESVSLILVQFMRDGKGYAYMKSYNLISYVIPIIEQWKKQDNICFIICDCQMQWNSKTKQNYPQIYDMKIETTLNIKLDESEN